MKLSERLSVAIVGLALALASIPTGGQNQPRTWNFDGMPAGAPGPLFVAGPGEWRIQPNSSAPTAPNVLAQVAKSERPIFNVLLVNDTNYGDLDLSVRMQSVAGEVDQGGGLVWRAKDSQNYYIARYNPLENNFRVYKVVDGKRTQLQSADIPHSAGWHTLRITMKGDTIECYFDGKKFLQAADAALPGSGKIGLWTKADAQTLFDNLTVSTIQLK